MRIGFRVDTNEKIALGHLMRCLSIANAYNSQEKMCTFITADNNGEEIIKESGYKHVSLDSVWDHLDDEIPKLKKVIQQFTIEVIVIDSYYVTELYLKSIQELTKVVYIDDLNKFHYSVDALINYSIYADEFGYQQQYPDKKLLLGCNYVPLRRQFQDIGGKKILQNVKKVLLTTGGTDNQGVIEAVLEKILSRERFNDVEIIVVAGTFYSRLRELKKKEKHNKNIHVYYNVSNIAELMIQSDVAVSAGGSTLYELACCGVPTVMFSFADNQLDNVNRFSHENLMEYAGDMRMDFDFCVENIYSKLVELMEDRKIREQKSRRLQQLVDGHGSWRLIDELCNMFAIKEDEGNRL